MRFSVLLAAALICASPAGAYALSIGDPAPVLVAPELDGGTFDLSALKGHVVVVHFWASWCDACRLEMPALAEVSRRYGTRGVRIIAVSVDRPHDRDEVRTLMSAYPYPAFMLNEATANGFGMPAQLPTTYVIDRDGRVRATLQPDKHPLSEKDFESAIEPLLAR